jgi:hypothetical protein
MESLPTFIGLVLVGVATGITNAFMEDAVKVKKRSQHKQVNSDLMVI